MKSTQLRVQVIVLFLLILANFIAQVPYYLRLYYDPNNLLASARGIVIMLLVFAFFLVASVLLFQRRVLGYWLMVAFLSVEFLFYLWNAIIEIVSGNGLFFHLANPEPILKAVFAVGYINLFASGYFLALLLLKRRAFLPPSKEEHSPNRLDIVSNP